MYRSVPSKHPLPGKRPCAAFQGVYVAASIQTYGILIPGSAHAGQNHNLCLSTHGHLPGTLRHIIATSAHSFQHPWPLIYVYIHHKEVPSHTHLTTSPSLTRRFLLTTRFMRIFSLLTVSSDRAMQTYSEKIIFLVPKSGQIWLSHKQGRFSGRLWFRMKGIP